MKKEKTDLPLNYITIKTTQSRIDKGLLAIPVSLIDIFPNTATKIYLIDEKGNKEEKTFTPYNSSSRECRIGGMKSFYRRFNIRNNDELVVQILDDNVFRIIPEKIFQNTFKLYLNNFDKSETDSDIEDNLKLLSNLSNLSKKEILQNEFVRLSMEDISERKIVQNKNVLSREKVNYSLRKILLELYKGKCQISNFTFLMKNGIPYFELHHIDSNKGNHLKNILVVSPNIHAQFTYCELVQTFDEEGWLRKVKFNNEQEMNVFQIIDYLPKKFEKEIHL
ncbi:MAG: HNH endonuclease [Bacteroidota bacterium]|nr:HNH endonuclease [Bacteroidota bacterium]